MATQAELEESARIYAIATGSIGAKFTESRRNEDGTLTEVCGEWYRWPTDDQDD